MSEKWYVTGQKYGRVLLSTRHKSMSSAQIEVAAWVSRLERGEADEVFVQSPDGTPARRITRANLHELPRSWGGYASEPQP